MTESVKTRPDAVIAERRRGLFLEFGIGVPMNVVLAAALYGYLLPTYPGLDTPEQRVLFALQCTALPALMMLAGLFAVALGRAANPEAANPLDGGESRTHQIHIRYFTNTAEQLLLFLVSSVALAGFLDEQTIRIIPTFAVLFVINRALFWAGYLRDPSLRGLGLSGTLYPISILSVWAGYLALRMIVTGSS